MNTLAYTFLIQNLKMFTPPNAWFTMLNDIKLIASYNKSQEPIKIIQLLPEENILSSIEDEKKN